MGILVEDDNGVIDVAEYRTNLLIRQNNSSSLYSANKLPKAGPSGKPMATPPVCLCIVLLKLNATEVIATVRISVKSTFGIVRETNSFLCKVSA